MTRKMIKVVLSSLLLIACLTGLSSPHDLTGLRRHSVSSPATEPSRRAPRPSILRPESFRHYIDSFNKYDRELYPQYIPNAKSYAFLSENIPLFDCPDRQLQQTYYFRWWTWRKHIRRTPEGFVILEFLPDVSWAGKYNTINCAAALHLAEGRWLRDPEYVDAYSKFWYGGGGDKHAYSSWMADAVWQRFLVTGDKKLPLRLEDSLVADYRQWEKDRLDDNGLFWQTDGKDGMEVSICGGDNDDRPAYRATLNSYMYGNALAISHIAGLAGHRELEEEFLQKAARIKQSLLTRLWDSSSGFFKVLSREENPTVCPSLELHGYTPWLFNIPSNEYAGAWKFLMDTHFFYAPYGPTTAAQNDPGFKIAYQGHECQWNGPSWPFATSVTLTALANYLNTPSPHTLADEDYFKLLLTYSRSQQRHGKDGKMLPWIDENLNPFTGDWISRTRLANWNGLRWPEDKGGEERGKDYNHSTFCDLIINGLVGLRPDTGTHFVINPLLPVGRWDYFCLDRLAYHGHTLTILYDKRGEHYHKGTGLLVYVDGQKAASANTLQHLDVELSPGITQHPDAAPSTDFTQPADYVNPFIGASTSAGKAGVFHGLGKTFPGAATPFGLVQVSPNTITGGDNGSGYSYEHTSLEGFAFTQMSGIGWYGDLGNFLVTPSSGALKTSAGRADHPGEGYRLTLSKKDEKASAGYYAATLRVHPDSIAGSNPNPTGNSGSSVNSNASSGSSRNPAGSDIRAEATATPHSGFLRFSFPRNDRSRIQIDLARRVGGTSTQQYIKVIDDHTIQGWMKCTPDGGGWGDGDGQANYTVYFYAQFSKPIRDFGIWSADIPDDWKRKREDVGSDRYQDRIAHAAVLPGVREMTGRHLGFYTQFATTEGEQVLLKSGISFVSMQGAEQNLKTEIKDWDFNGIVAAAHDQWNQALGKIAVQGGSKEEQTVFYTALYHTMIDPRASSDVDGKYPAANGKVGHSSTFTRRTIFSGWDVFRSQFPLQTIINPKVVSDMVNSLVELGDESDRHYLERWELLNAYSGCMIGNPAVVVMTDAYAKGVRDFDIRKGYVYAKKSVDLFGNGDKGYTGGENSISKTLEYAYSDWCLSRLAGWMGNKKDATYYGHKALNYRNIFDDSAHWFRPRKEDGSWEPWPAAGRLQQDYGTVESNPYQQGWFVPQDIPGMVRLMGGKDKVRADLESLFDHTPENMMWNDYYNHANEPVHHIPFLFNRIGYPWLTQKWTRAICARAYHNSVEGLVGNEDVGQMSAWYVLAASGLHPVCPGDTRYEITSPVFDRIVIQLDPAYSKGKTFTIIAHNNSPENSYIQSATLNGRQYLHCFLDYKDLTAGGILELNMGKTPSMEWGVEQITVIDNTN